MTSARSVCMTVSRVSGAGLCGVGSITLSGGKGSACYPTLDTPGGCVGFLIFCPSMTQLSHKCMI